MRVTQNMLDRNLLHAIGRRMDRLNELNQKLSSGRAFDTVSEDPSASAQVLRAERADERISTCQRNLDSADAALSAAGSVLQTASEVLSRARQLATQAATGTYTDADRVNMAHEIDKLLGNLVSLSNTRANGQYLFSGASGEVQPFRATADAQGLIQGVEYRGAATSAEATVAPGRKSEVNLVGRDIFQRGGNPFETLIRLRNALNAGNTEGARNLIDDLRANEQGVRSSLGIVGSRQSELNLVRSTLDRFSEISKEIISRWGDADLAEASVQYRRDTVALQWALKVAAQVSMPSLANYL